jgi:hypothetical protein
MAWSIEGGMEVGPIWNMERDIVVEGDSLVVVLFRTPGLALSARAKMSFAKEKPLEGPTYLLPPEDKGIRPISWAISFCGKSFAVEVVSTAG